MHTMTATESVCSGCRVAEGWGWPFPQHRLISTFGQRVNCSRADFVSVCFHAPASADVAVPLPCLTTIAQFARGLESLGGEGLLLEEPVPACAEKLVAKLRPTSWCVTWTSQHPIHVMVAGWRSWWMDYPNLEESKLPWTPHWFPLFCDGSPTPGGLPSRRLGLSAGACSVSHLPGGLCVSSAFLN